MKLKVDGIVLIENKYKFFKTKVKILGSISSQFKIKQDPERVSAIQEYGKPNTIKQLRSFLELANYVRDYVHRFSEIANPFTELLKGKKITSNKRIEYNQQSTDFFDERKNAITNVTFRSQPV